MCTRAFCRHASSAGVVDDEECTQLGIDCSIVAQLDDPAVLGSCSNAGHCVAHIQINHAVDLLLLQEHRLGIQVHHKVKLVAVVVKQILCGSQPFLLTLSCHVPLGFEQLPAKAGVLLLDPCNKGADAGAGLG